MRTPTRHDQRECGPATYRPRAFVTGSSQGIGRAIAEALVEDGLTVCVHSRSSDTARRVAAELGPSALAVSGDLGIPGAPARLVDAAAELMGGLDILVNNAGMAAPAPAIELSSEAWDATLQLNLTAPFQCAQAAARHMLRGELVGSIVNITSIAAYRWPVHRAAYVASKAALRTLTEALAGEWAPRIRVNSVAPGYTETEMVGQLVSDGHVDRLAIERDTPMARLGTPMEVARTVAFLCSDAAAFVTGVNIPVDGGWVVNPRRSLAAAEQPTAE